MLKRLVSVATFTPAIILSACATTPTPTPTDGGNPQQQVVTPPAIQWGVKTREHVDLWLHGYAMLQKDTTLVPFFKRGYKDAMTVRKNQQNVTTQLDVNTENLAAKLNDSRILGNAQFLPLYFSNLDDMRRAIDLFLGAYGDPSRVSREDAPVVAMLTGYFPSSPEREWLRLFSQSLFDEHAKFYSADWKTTQRERFGVLTVVDSIWQKMYRPRLQRFLNNSQQKNGSIYLSLPLDGEGRTLNGGGTENIITTTFPDNEANSVESIYVIVHELVGSIAASAVNDFTTPNDRRTGAADRLQGIAAVRAGAILLERLIPELAEGYARYYLRSAGKPVGSNPLASLQTHFPLVADIPKSINSQMDIILGGV